MSHPNDVKPASSYSTSEDVDPPSAKANRLQVVLAGMTDGVMMIDAELRLVEWNAQFPDFTGVPERLLRVGLPFEDILRAQASVGEFGEVDVEAEVGRRLARLRAGASSGTIERKRPNGRIMELRRNPLADGGFVTLYTDITVRRHAEDQLRQAQKMEAVGHLTGGVAHDFNNLLMIILGNLDVAERSLKSLDLDRAGRGIERARSGARRGAALTQRLLAFSRRQPREPQPVDPNTLITDLSDLIRQSATTRVSVEFALVKQPWLVLADPNQLEIALLNLVVNARDAMPKGGSLTIETAKITRGSQSVSASLQPASSEFVQITVRDSGTGMSREVAARAIEPFFTTKEAGKGTGLGLYQVLDFAMQAGGHVTIDSELGVGTAVTIHLPRFASAGASGVAPHRSIEPSPVSSFGEKILIVENESEILTYTMEGLEALGYQVIGARDASSALTILEATPDVALLFTDLGLPGISGYQLSAEAARRRPDLPIVFTSGGPGDPLHRGETSGREVACIAKPYALPKLAHTIRLALDTRRDPKSPVVVQQDLGG
ncbi:PAS-domain containing protein [Muricoccus nepalensis]|uniref:PAS-domain containing protein n=1 Tax=Muricoccus nepalensis TaxID=1854500 RepID=UPI0013873326|nr:PAS-domain containing protein [Roseomonas nepalensis]